MKVLMTLATEARADRTGAGGWTAYEKFEDDGRLAVEGIDRIRRGMGGDLVLERGELVFDYPDHVVLAFEVEPEALRTKLKGEAIGSLATLQDCDRCRSGDVLLPCSCARWCGYDNCFNDDGRMAVDRGPRLASPWDKEDPNADDTILAQ